MQDKTACGSVAGIYIGKKGVELDSVALCQVTAGQGIDGDRYSDGSGTFSLPAYAGKGRDLTMIAEESVASCNAQLGSCFNPKAFRRNILTRGIDIDSYVGVTMRIGTAVVTGVRPCDPCRYLESLLGDHVFKALAGIGGLRCDVLESGQIRVGDELLILSQ